MQSSLGPRPIRPLSQRFPTLIGGLSAFCINSQIIMLQHSLLSSLQSLSLSPHLFHNSSFCSFILLIPPFIATFPSGFSLPLPQITVFTLFSLTTYPLLFYLPLTLSSDFFFKSFYSPTSSCSLSLSLSNDRLCVIVCLSTKRPHHLVQCSPLVLMGVQWCNHDTMVITLKECCVCV